MLILASASPRRKELLKLTGLEFKIIPSSCEEIVPIGFTPKETVEYLSRIKALDLKNCYDTIIGSDTVVSIDGEILGKPTSKENAREILKKLSGRTHSVFTGVTIIKGNEIETFSVETKVVFYELSEKDIENYLKNDEYKDKAGAYAIQGKGMLFVKEIIGDYSSVVGLPVGEVYRRLKWNEVWKNG